MSSSRSPPRFEPSSVTRGLHDDKPEAGRPEQKPRTASGSMEPRDQSRPRARLRRGAREPPAARGRGLAIGPFDGDRPPPSGVLDDHLVEGALHLGECPIIGLVAEDLAVVV